MNCYNHSTVSATAQCVCCAKGVCSSCAKTSSPVLCASCFENQRIASIRSNVLYLGSYVLFFIIGYCIDFMSYKGGHFTGVYSGFILMALVSGRQFINSGAGRSVETYSAAGWLLGLIFKVFIYTIIGMVVLPYNLIKTTINLVDASRCK